MGVTNQHRPRCTICRHPDSELVNAALIGGASERTVADRFELSRAAVHRHAANHVPALAAKAIAAQDVDRGAQIAEEVQTVLRRIRKMSDACDEYLQHPADPERYFLGPRADELTVLYETWEEVTDVKGRSRALRRRELKPLSEFLDELRGLQGEAVHVRYRHADPRKLLIDAANSLHRWVDVWARIAEQLAGAVADAAASQEWAELRSTILRVMEDYPEARAALQRELAKEKAA